MIAALSVPQVDAVRATLACEVAQPGRPASDGAAQPQPLQLDPVRFTGADLLVPVLAPLCRRVAAYLVRVGAKLVRVAPNSFGLRSLRLPPAFRSA